MKTFTIIYLLLCFYVKGITQNSPINVSENTLKLTAMSEELFYYSFAEGDQIIFSFYEMSNRELKELEILEYPSSSRFMEYKTKKVENKIITVHKTGVYCFRLNNSAILGRICKIKIDRIPATDRTRSFNTAVKWINKPDTTWNVYTKEVIAGYDTLRTPKIEKKLVKTELSEDLFMTKTERVHSQTNSNGNRTSVFFTVPRYPSTELVKKKVTSLIYWVGVGEEANKQWEKNIKSLKNLTTKATGLYTSPLGAFAVGAIADIALPNLGEDVLYALVDEPNKNLFYSEQGFESYDRGKGIAGFRKFTNPLLLRGTWHIVLLNDNITLGINVNIKVSVIVETTYYEERAYVEQTLSPRYETRTFKDPIITYNKVPSFN